MVSKLAPQGFGYDRSNGRGDELVPELAFKKIVGARIRSLKIAIASGVSTSSEALKAMVQAKLLTQLTLPVLREVPASRETDGNPPVFGGLIAMVTLNPSTRNSRQFSWLKVGLQLLSWKRVKSGIPRHPLPASLRC
jgi:hypothetical protein